MVTHLSRPVADNFPDEWIDKVCEADPLPDDFDPEDEGSIPTGLTLTPKEIEAACVELGRWQSVETFSRTERPLRLRNADRDFFVQPSSNSYTMLTCSPNSQQASAPIKFASPIVATSGRTALSGSASAPSKSK